MRSLRLRLITLLASALLFCAPATAEIFIGIAGPTSGPNASFGNELRVGVNAAVAALNAAGGINGETLAVVEGDDACDSRRAADVAQQLIQKDVRMVVGHFCSSASMAAAPVYERAGVLMMTPSATFPELTAKSLWNVFRLTGREDLQADLAVAQIKASPNPVDVLLVTDGQFETTPLAKRFQQQLPTAKTITVKPGDIRLPDDTAVVISTSAYLALQSSDAAIAARGLKRLNPSIQIYGPDYLQSELYGVRVADAANGTQITFLQDFATIADPRRTATMASKEGATLASFAAVEAFKAAAVATNVNDGRAMARWLASGSTVDSVIGPLRFTNTGDLQNQPYVWYRWNNGTLTAEPKTP
jgi:branched-chain amino acid transport system substrate-binding protein